MSHFDLVQNALDIACPKLTSEQVSIIDECMTRDKYGLSVPMGKGKTFMSLVIGLRQKIIERNKNPILVFASKSLIVSWEYEINKFFGKSLVYQTFGPKNSSLKICPETMLLIMTAETAGSYYKANDISEKFIIREKYYDYRTRLPVSKNTYNNSTVPYLQSSKSKNDGSIIYRLDWAAMIIDEGHKYTNISTLRSQAIASVCSKHRIMLSGTLFDEPDFERILGYYVILQIPKFPRNLPDAIKVLKRADYEGIRHTTVERSSRNKEIEHIKVNKILVQHDLGHEESLIYIAMKRTINVLRTEYRKANLRTGIEKKKFSSYLITMISRLRQGIVVPIIPVANIVLELEELKDNRSMLSEILMKEFNKLNINEFLSNADSARSTRIGKIIDVLSLKNKKTDKTIMFSCFDTSLKMIKYYINKELDIKIFQLSSTQNFESRGKLIESFKEYQGSAILLTTYELGAEGLNLQCANSVIIVDFWWNQAKTQQAISRVVRRGQESNVVDLYFFTSNTGVERCLFEKQQDKLILLEEIKSGPFKSVVKKMTMHEMLRLIDIHENTTFLTNNYNITSHYESS